MDLKIKESASHLALWITSILFSVPFIILLKYGYTDWAFLLFLLAILFCLKIWYEINSENPNLVFGKSSIKFKDGSSALYNDVGSFHFIMFEADKKMKIHPLWWTGRKLLLRLIYKNGKVEDFPIPNQFKNIDIVKSKIRSKLSAMEINEEKEVIIK